MATPTLGSTPTTIDNADVITGWTLLATNDVEFKVEGAGSQSGTMRNDLALGYYDIVVDGGAQQNMTGRHVRLWINFTAIGFLDIEANGGMEFYMYDGTNTAYWVAFGSNTYAGGWKNFVLDCDRTPESGSFDKTSVDRWGLRFNRTAAPANRVNTWVDYLRYGDGYYATGGTSGDEIDLNGIYALDAAAAYGIVTRAEGVYFCTGALTAGNGATTTWFEMLGEVIVWLDAKVATGLYKLVGAGSGCRVNIQGSVLRGGGTTDGTRFILDMDDADLVSCAINGSFIRRAGECRFKASQNIEGNTFDDCGQILAAGALLNGSIVQAYNGTADTAALVWNNSGDPDGNLDDMTFTKGTASAHAIQLGTSSPSTLTLRGITFSGYNSADAATDSVLLLSDKGSNTSWTINAVGCSGTVSYKKVRSGDTVTVVVDPVSLAIHVQNVNTGTAISGARVWVPVTSTASGRPYNQTINSITRASQTATVTFAAAHNLATNDYLNISGCAQPEYNHTFQITKTGTTTLEVTVTGTPASGSGTMVGTWVIINGTTDGSGNISASYTYAASQPISGRVRTAASGGPYYKTAPISGTVSSTAGLSVTVQMIPDA